MKYLYCLQVKPWLFEEIKTKRYRDISSRERFDILKKYCDYGLEYWGSDSVVGIQNNLTLRCRVLDITKPHFCVLTTQGVNTTRRFLCEWLSFLHR
jgi:tRNA-dihydrouridine synthase 3